MAFVNWQVATQPNGRYTPAVYGTTETVTLIGVSAGDIVGAAFVVVGVGFDGSPTAVYGDGFSTNRFMTTTDTGITTASALPKLGTGAGFATMPGYLYTSDDTVDIVYTTGGSPTVGNLFFWIWKTKAFPF